jgi:hypothetical protein
LEEGADGDGNAELFVHLAAQALGEGLAAFELAAGEVPLAALVAQQYDFAVYAAEAFDGDGVAAGEVVGGEEAAEGAEVEGL